MLRQRRYAYIWWYVVFSMNPQYMHSIWIQQYIQYIYIYRNFDHLYNSNIDPKNSSPKTCSQINQDLFRLW